MSQKSTRRQPRRPSAPRPGASAARRPSVPSPAAAPSAAAPTEMPLQLGHVGRDLRRILVIGALMFALIFGARMMANTYGTNFVIEAIR